MEGGGGRVPAVMVFDMANLKDDKCSRKRKVLHRLVQGRDRTFLFLCYIKTQFRKRGSNTPKPKES